MAPANGLMAVKCEYKKVPPRNAPEPGNQDVEFHGTTSRFSLLLCPPSHTVRRYRCLTTEALKYLLSYLVRNGQKSRVYHEKINKLSHNHGMGALGPFETCLFVAGPLREAYIHQVTYTSRRGGWSVMELSLTLALLARRNGGKSCADGVDDARCWCHVGKGGTRYLRRCWLYVGKVECWSRSWTSSRGRRGIQSKGKNTIPR